LLQAREEEEEDRGEKKRREEKRYLDWSLSRSKSFFFFCCDSFVFSNKKFYLWFLSLALLRKPNREAKAWRRWWWC
jgi:hypothetical protein